MAWEKYENRRKLSRVGQISCHRTERRLLMMDKASLQDAPFDGASCGYPMTPREASHDLSSVCSPPLTHFQAAIHIILFFMGNKQSKWE